MRSRKGLIRPRGGGGGYACAGVALPFAPAVPSHLHSALLLPLSIFCLLFPSSTFSFLSSSSLSPPAPPLPLFLASLFLLPLPHPFRFIPSSPLPSHCPAPCSCPCLPVPCPPAPTLCAPSLGALSSSQLGGRLCPLPVLVPLLWGPFGGRGRQVGFHLGPPLTLCPSLPRRWKRWVRGPWVGGGLAPPPFLPAPPLSPWAVPSPSFCKGWVGTSPSQQKS